MTTIKPHILKIASSALVFAASICIEHSVVADDIFSAEEQQSIEKIIRDYLLENPELIKEVISKFNEQKEARIVAESRQAVQDYWDVLANDPIAFSIGKPDASITVIEFFDYNCGFCRSATPSIFKALETNDDLRIVFREFPIRGRVSEEIAKLALASVNQGKYVEFHNKLMAAEGQLTVERARHFAKSVDLNVKKLEKDAENPEFDAAIKLSHTLAEALYINGTPSFIIGTEVVQGWPGRERFYELIAKASGVGIVKNTSD